ncbi:subclass B3 metallo-beta-lactamase [Chitinophaga agri]|uniref:Subclass B3 metallo-beta-lactamase n=1 Tax=Chitinophaga agri TaxID=2703787 RepID=A0A6B9Z888_9BACT|nr:subclass B3 metallo-beta-lactamase [Chitinophaga agri]QHS58440.1 subclass B3 metallo-beta-lactamase [Chitinophaga agri]
MKFHKRLLPVILLTILSASLYKPATAQQLIKDLYVDKEWSKDYQPFRIAGNLYYIGTYDLGIFLITTPAGHILINTGAADSEALIKAHMKALGFKFKDIRILLTTHAHYDHVGAMAAIKKQTHARMMVNEKDAALLADGGNSDYVMGGKGMMFLPVKADRILHDKDTISLGGMNIVVLHHPGHTPGANSFLFNVQDTAHTYRVLIANIPSILDDTQLAGMPLYPEVGKDYAHTLKVMKEVQFDLWLAAHASQYDLHKKHQPGDPYHPAAFSDRAGYDEVLDYWQKTYDKRLNK